MFGSCVLISFEAPVLYELAGPSMQTLESHFRQMLLDTETENTIELFRTLVTMRMRTLPQEVRYGMLSNRGLALWATGMSWRVCWIIYL